jgi:two-component system CheB/CheR fusion protein
MPARDPPAAQQRPRDSSSSAAAPLPTGAALVVVGIGASAGGLEACRLFLEALPASPGMAFILIQHLDPTHDSMMVELLTSATQMPVVQAQDGMAVEIDHLYIIPPGLYLAIEHGRLSLSAPLARHGSRLPFDFLLHSLAVSLGANAACVVLSGSGADGTVGVQAIKAAGGLVIAQDPAEAGSAGMPESAIATGAVDFTLPASEIAGELARFGASRTTPLPPAVTADVIALLKSLTPHDFTLYKSGTMDRRIARRMTMAGLGAGDTALYMARLQADEDERLQLANDLLINVTSFFRDPKIFELLAATIIPELVSTGESSIRLWVAGCSTGEETYSLAMLLIERIESENARMRLQIFATDVDAQAVMLAREGFYPPSIEKDVSPVRLARFFIREDHGYRVSPALRGCVIFAVQDVLSDPPFSKLNMVSCRNLLIYLRPEAQEKIISIFNFALRGGGILLLGAAETVSGPDPRFEQISKPARIYRKIRHGGADHLPTGSPSAEFLRLSPRYVALKSKAADIGETCRRLVLEHYAPAALLINARLEILYTFGATDGFLSPATGLATHDMLAQLPPGLRGRMRDAVAQAAAGGMAQIDGGRVTRHGETQLFRVEIQRVPEDANKFLVCFISQPKQAPTAAAMPAPTGGARIAELEAELAATQRDLLQAVHSLESSAEEHNAIHEEALSVNEEYQSTNEELLTSKEELQSLNEELTALNSQLQETLERSRMTSTDLRNVLYSTDVPTLFLDEKLNIRFFTPSATLLFRIIPSDIGRKLADFRSLAIDAALLPDAAAVLKTAADAEREIQTENGSWYMRRIQPYRTYDGVVAGVVITFLDITDRKAAAATLEAARREAENANIAKSRFLAAASHDLRQPLQTMVLINGLLRKTATNAASQKLIARLDQTMQSITAMLNTMLDINQIEAGIVHANVVSIRVNDLLARVEEKFRDQAAAQHTILRFVPCGLSIATDPALLEQMLCNLLGNALKYTKAGRVLLGCRRHGAMLRIEVWDTGIGIAANQLENIFDEYHQIDNAARERSRGLGLGLSIVQRLGHLLNHPVSVRSIPGRGSGFCIEVPRAAEPPHTEEAPAARPIAVPPNARILIIEDDPYISQLLERFLSEEGFVVAVAHDGPSAALLVAEGTIVPDLILADYNLPGSDTGLRVAQQLRAHLQNPVPVIITTGDISSVTLRLIADGDCVQMNKPMKLATLMETIQQLLAAALARPSTPTAPGPTEAGEATIYIIDDDDAVRHEMGATFQAAGMSVASYPDGERFLAALPAVPGHACLIVDARLPGLSGLQLLEKLSTDGIVLPAIMVTGLGDIAMAVQAMKAGATDFLEKPASAAELLACVRRVLNQKYYQQTIEARRREAARQIASLTARQRQVMERVLAGHASKNIAADLGISQRTVENHRASIMLKTGAKSIPALARLAVAAALPPVT